MSCSSMKRLRLLLGTFLFFGLGSTANAQVNSKAVACPSDPSVTGYVSIADINQDQFDELARVTAGSSQSSPPYSFVLCPNTNFDASNQTLNIVLSGTVISCGNDMAASSALGCSIQGGSSQVYLADSTTPNYDLTSVTIIGVTFEMFNGTSIDVMATETLTLTLMDVVWKNFFSDFVIRQQQPVAGTFPARVDLVGGVVDNGMGGSLFSNDAGVLVLDQLTVANITCAGLVSTSNGGVVMMQSSQVSRSVIDTVASAMMGSTLSIMDVDVFDLIFTKTVFHVSDSGSMLLLNRTKIREINNEGQWKGVTVADSADAKLEQMEFNLNGRFQSLVEGQNSAAIEMSDCLFDRNFGLGTAALSSAVYLLSSSIVIMSRSKFDDNTQLTALALASMQSSLTIQQSCFMGGSSDEVVFQSSDSTVSVSENYVATNVNSMTCPGGNVRLSVEQAGSQCYQQGSTSCMSTCDILADQTVCIADMVMLAPGANGTMGTNGTMMMGTAAPTQGSTSADVSSAPEPNGNATGTMPPAGGNATMTQAPTMGGNGTSPEGNATAPETSAPTDTGFTRIIVAFEVVNDMMITDPAEVNASGLGEAFPVYVEELVSNLTMTARRQLLMQQRRRLEISLVPGSALIYEIIPVGCVPDNRTSNMTTTNFTTCHEAMGRYDLLLSDDEDPIAVKTTFTRATRNGIDDGTLQQILLEVEPNSPLILGPSIEPRLPETSAPTISEDLPAPSGPPNTLFPTVTMPSCPPVSSKRAKSKGTSKSSRKGSKSAKGKGKGKGGSKGGRKGRKMMRRHGRTHGGGGTDYNGGRMLTGHGVAEGAHGMAEGAHGMVEQDAEHHHESEEGAETSHFANVLKEHDDLDYYIQDEVDFLDGDLMEIVVDECEDPEDYYYSSSKGGKGGSGRKGSKGASKDNYDYDEHRRQLLEEHELPRIHGAHHRSHRISDMRAMLEAELDEDPDDRQSLRSGR